MPQEQGGRIIWSGADWVEGLASNYGVLTTTFQKGGNQLTAATAFNPFRSYGNAYPGELPTTVTNSTAEVTEMCRKGLVKGTAAYIVTSGAKLQEVSNLIGIPSVTASFHNITHGAHTSILGDDCAIYTAKVGGTSASQFFYSWSDSTDWNVGVYDFASTFDDDFLSTAPATPLASPYLADGVRYPHPLVVGDDDLLYVGDRNFIHALDGNDTTDADGKFFPAVLTLPGGYIITSFAKTQNGLMIFAYLTDPVGISSSQFLKGSAKAFLWDYVSLDISYSYDLNDNYVTESFTYKGMVGCFTTGQKVDPSNSAKISKLQLFNGSIFEPVQTFIGELPIRGGVEIIGDSIQFNSEGTVYAWGSPLFGTKSGLNKLSRGTGASGGLLSTFSTVGQFISTGTIGTGGLELLSGLYDGSALLATTVAEPGFPMGQRGQVKAVKVTYADVSVDYGVSVSISILPRAGSSATIVSALAYVASGETSRTFYLDTSGNALPVFEAIKLIVQWGGTAAATDAPGISQVELLYETVNVN